MENIGFILSFFLYLFTGKIFLETILNLSIKNNFTKRNYKGDLIPKSLGIVLLLNIILGAVFWCTIYPKEYYTHLFYIIPVGTVGLLDDIFGDEKIKGFKENFKKLFSGEFTTGILKAIFVFLISFWMVFSYSGKINMINFVDILIITLFTNFFNLLDLRPSRAIKFFLVCFLIISIFSKNLNYELIPLISAVLIITPFDFKAKAMLGDTGSNILGFSIGLMYVENCKNFLLKIFILIFLVIFHIFCEKYSLSRIIEKNKFLNYIDKLGT